MTGDIQAGWVPIVPEPSAQLRQEMHELQKKTEEAWNLYCSLAAQADETRARLATAIAAEQAQEALGGGIVESPIPASQQTAHEIERLRDELVLYKVELAFIKGPNYRPGD